MVAYELSLVMKPLPKVKLVGAVKRTAESILRNRGFIEKIEYLGSRQLPFKIISHGHGHFKGSYFLIHFHTPYESFEEIKDFCKRDVDVIRPVIFPKKPYPEFTCSLHEETKPPAYRAEVSQMIKEAEKRLPVNLRIRKRREKETENYMF